MPALTIAKAASTPRLRTRLFAARCVLELPAAVGDDPRHFDALAAQRVCSPLVFIEALCLAAKHELVMRSCCTCAANLLIDDLTC